VSGLQIQVSRGVGTGPTRLAAFDAALQDAGVADFNLIRLSSVIPPGSVVTTGEGGEPVAGGFGDVLYCVYADSYASVPGEAAWSGMAWASREDGGGLFVEHSSATQDSLEHDLAATIHDLMRRRPGDYGPPETMVQSARCERLPVCALVVAAYTSATLTRREEPVDPAGAGPVGRAGSAGWSDGTRVG
jgi:arginine decarboxylase